MKRTELKRRAPRKRKDGLAMCVIAKCRRARYEDKLCAKHLADKRFAEHVRNSDLGLCEAEGTDAITCNGGLQCAHVISRRYMALRWSTDNAVPLCSAHHVYYTLHPLEWEEWCISAGIDYANLRYLALKDPPQSPVEVLERGWETLR